MNIMQEQSPNRESSKSRIHETDNIDVVQLCQFARWGLNRKQIAKILDLNVHAVSSAVRRLGIECEDGRATDPEIVDEASRLYQSGESIARVAARFGYTRGGMYKMLLRNGVEIHGQLGDSLPKSLQPRVKKK